VASPATRLVTIEFCLACDPATDCRAVHVEHSGIVAEQTLRNPQTMTNIREVKVLVKVLTLVPTAAGLPAAIRTIPVIIDQWFASVLGFSIRLIVVQPCGPTRLLASDGNLSLPGSVDRAPGIRLLTSLGLVRSS